MTTKAYEAGKADGADWAKWANEQDCEYALRGNGVELEEGLNAPGKFKADEGLINACTADCLAKVLGLSIRMVDARGARFSAACDEYNRGWDAAVQEAIEQRGRLKLEAVELKAARLEADNERLKAALEAERKLSAEVDRLTGENVRLRAKVEGNWKEVADKLRRCMRHDGESHEAAIRLCELASKLPPGEAERVLEGDAQGYERGFNQGTMAGVGAFLPDDAATIRRDLAALQSQYKILEAAARDAEDYLVRHCSWTGSTAVRIRDSLRAAIARRLSELEDL